MENEEKFRKLMCSYFNTIKTANNKDENYIAQVKFSSYYELGCTINDMLKLCILGLENNVHKISETDRTTAINLPLILEVVHQLFPMNEFEFLDEIDTMFLKEH
ncbi:hypothetical protein FLAPXU55_02584 [Flavobacterium panici]|uniref:Uncharacterized protein n=2 Tax=Flavobacterium panici TaxID=2654843 RepID=A0A9N8J2F7_9FLAO|nr:hypothetical protein FLAPXU55_02584 [Flavobacterium panici]